MIEVKQNENILVANHTGKKAGFFKQFKTEVKKTKYRNIWLIILAMILLHFMWTAWILGKADVSELADGYSYLLFELPAINAITLPVLLAMIASRLCDIENKGNTLKLLCTLQKKGRVYDCKLLLGSMYIIFIIVMQLSIILLQSQMFHFKNEMPYYQMLCYVISTFIVSMAILLIQQILSLLFENQIAPLTVGLLGSFMGLFSMFFPEAVQRLVIWGYYGVFSTVAYKWDEKTRILSFYEVPFEPWVFIYFFIVSILIYLIGKYLFMRKEV